MEDTILNLSERETFMLIMIVVLLLLLFAVCSYYNGILQECNDYIAHMDYDCLLWR